MMCTDKRHIILESVGSCGKNQEVFSLCWDHVSRVLFHLLCINC